MLKLMKPKKYISAGKNSSFVRNVMGRNMGNVSYLTAEEELILAQMSGISENNGLEELLRLLQMLAAVLEGSLGFGNYKSETYIINQLRVMFESRRMMLSQDALYQQLQNLYNEIVDKFENKNIYAASGNEFLKSVKNELLNCRSELNQRTLNIRNLFEADKVTGNTVTDDKRIVPHYRRSINVSEENLNINTINYNMFNMLRRNQSLIEQAKDNYFFKESLAVYSKKNQRKYQFRQQITNFLDKLTPKQQSFIIEFAKNEHLLSIEKNTVLGEKKTDVYDVFENASEHEIRQFFSRLNKFSEKKINEKKITEKEVTKISVKENESKEEIENKKKELRSWQEHTRESFLNVVGDLFSTNGKDEFYRFLSEENISHFTASEKTDREILMSVIGKIKNIPEKKKSRDMIKTVSQMNTDTLIAYSDSVMNYIQNSEMDFTEETLKLEENLEQIYYSGDFNQNGVEQIRELLNGYYLTVKTDELEAVSESFFGMENDGRINKILRILNQHDLDSIAVFLKLFEGEYSEISELLENYENEKKLFLNNEIKEIAKSEVSREGKVKIEIEGNGERRESEYNETVSRISVDLSERLAGFFERLKDEEETRLVSVVNETTDRILHENEILIYIQQYAVENDQKEEYEEFINKIENVFKSGLINFYKTYNPGQKEYREAKNEIEYEYRNEAVNKTGYEIRNEIRKLLENEEISKNFIQYLRQGKTPAQEDSLGKFTDMQVQEEYFADFVKTQMHVESFEDFSETQLTEKLSESLFSVMKQLNAAVRNEVNERFSASGESVIYLETTEKTTDKTSDKTDSVKVSSREILNDKSEKLVRDESALYENKTLTVSAKERVSSVWGEISGVLTDKLLEESLELTYLQEYAIEIGQSDEFKTLLEKIENSFEENLLKKEKKIIRQAEEITDGNHEEITDGKSKSTAEGKSDGYLFDAEIVTEIQNILLNDELSLKFIRYLQGRVESLDEKITDVTISEKTSEVKSEATGKEINEIRVENANELNREKTDRSIIESSKDIIEKFETVNFKNMTETEIASMISLTLERIFANLKTDFSSVISEKALKLSLLSDERQNVQVGLNSEAFVERLMKESPELTLLQQYAEETDREEEFDSLLKKIEENFKTGMQQSINHMQNEGMSVFDSKSPKSDIIGKKTTRYDEQSDEQLEEKLYEKHFRENNTVYRSEGVVKEIQNLLVNEEFGRDFIKYLTKVGKSTDKSWVLKEESEKAADELTELNTAEMLSEYLVDRLKNVETETSKNNISKININKINTAVMQDEILTERTLIENASSEKTLSEKIFTDDSWLTYMKNYAVETGQESQLRTLLQKIEDKLTYNAESLKAELRYLLENSEISKSFMERFENTEEVLTAANAKSGQHMTENEVTLTQITELMEYRTDIQGYLRQTYYADDIKNSRYQMYAGDVVEKNHYQSLLQGDLSYQYVDSSEEYFENSKASGEIQYALSPGENEGAVNERVEKQLGDVKQKLEQITRNVNKLNSVQAGMKEEFIRKNDMVSFRKELLNHLEEDISTAGKRQGILH